MIFSQGLASSLDLRNPGWAVYHERNRFVPQSLTVTYPVDTNRGGCHAQFGWYGLQKNENLPTMSHEAQQEIITTATLDLLAQVGKPQKQRE